MGGARKENRNGLHFKGIDSIPKYSARQRVVEWSLLVLPVAVPISFENDSIELRLLALEN